MNLAHRRLRQDGQAKSPSSRRNTDVKSSRTLDEHNNPNGEGITRGSSRRWTPQSSFPLPRPSSAISSGSAPRA